VIRDATILWIVTLPRETIQRSRLPDDVSPCEQILGKRLCVARRAGIVWTNATELDVQIPREEWP
jgi:hypothetical protein